MKRKIFFAAFLLSLSLLFSLPIAAEGAGESGGTWGSIDFDAVRAWFEAEVLPHLATVGTVLGVALVELIPAVRSLIKAKNAFSKVAADVDAYNQAKIEYDLRVEEREKAFEARIEELQKEHLSRVEEFNTIARQFEEKLQASEKILEEHLDKVEKNASKTERMCYLAFTNSGELVSNGAAHHIADVEKERAVWEEDDDVEA